jgi:L-phenylalanine/L-methionine N-acetyltransferase
MLLPIKFGLPTFGTMARSITSADFDFIYSLYMHPTVNPWLLYEQMDAMAFKPVFEDLLSKNILFILEAEARPVGMFKFIQQPYRNHHVAYLGGLAIHPDFSRKGYGQLMMNDILELGKSMGILRIELTVATINKKAIALYEKNGFVQEGVLRKFTHLVKEDRYIDEVMMRYLY